MSPVLAYLRSDLRAADMCAATIASRISVVVSSEMEGLHAEREAAREVISNNPSLEPVLFEDYGALSEGARDAYLGRVKRAKIVVCILAGAHSNAVEEEVIESLIERKDLLGFVKS